VHGVLELPFQIDRNSGDIDHATAAPFSHKRNDGLDASKGAKEACFHRVHKAISRSQLDWTTSSNSRIIDQNIDLTASLKACLKASFGTVAIDIKLHDDGDRANSPSRPSREAPPWTGWQRFASSR
jgi:hypothetical protein